MDIDFSPQQTGAVATAPEQNANFLAFQNALGAIEARTGQVIEDLHGEGILRGLQVIEGANYVTVTPGVAYVDGVRIVLEDAFNAATPSYSICRLWLTDSLNHPALLNVPADRINYNDNASNITYSGTTERVADGGAWGGYYSQVTNGTVTIQYSGRGPLGVLIRRSSDGGTGVVTARTRDIEGVWGEWEDGSAETSISFYADSTSYGNAVVVGAPESDGLTKQVKITITGIGYIEAFYYLDPDEDDTPSDYSMSLAWIYTGASGEIVEINESRLVIRLSQYWDKLIEVMYKLLATQIVCTDFWFDGFATLGSVGDNTTANVDVNAHQVDMGVLGPYPVSSRGSYDLLGDGSTKIEYIALTRTPVSLYYPRIDTGSVTVKDSTGTTTYASGYIVDYDNGTIAWDPDTDPNPIMENQTVQVTYTGISVTTLTALQAGELDVLVEVEQGTTADSNQASKVWLDREGEQAYTFTPKSGIVGAEGNGVQVTVANGTNQRSVISSLQFHDRAAPPDHCMELKSRVVGQEGNFIRAKIGDGEGQRLQNNSFETDPDTNWVAQENSQGTIGIDNGKGRTGSNSMLFDKTADTNKMRLYQVVDAKQSNQYRVTVWFASDACSADISGTLRVMSADRSTEVDSVQFLNSGNRNNTTFVSQTLDITCPPTMVRLSVVVDIDDGTGDVWVEDITMVTLTTDPFDLEVEDGHMLPFFSEIPIAIETVGVSSEPGDASNLVDSDKSTYWLATDDSPWVTVDYVSPPLATTGVSVFIPSSVGGYTYDDVTVTLETKDAVGAYTTVRTATAKMGWIMLRIPGGEVDCYGFRITLSAAAPVAMLKVYGDSEQSDPLPHDEALLDNLIDNPSFESWGTVGGKTQPVGWSYTVGGSPDDGEYNEQNALVLDSTRSALSSAGAANIGIYKCDEFSTIVGRDYVAYVMVRAQSLVACTVTASIIPYDGVSEGTPVLLKNEESATSITADCDWTLMAIRFTATEDYARMELKRNGQGDVYWDLAECYLASEVFSDLTVNEDDEALGWETPYILVENLINDTDDGSRLVTVVNMTGPTYPQQDEDMNPIALDWSYLAGGGTEYTTVKLTIKQYEVDVDGNPTAVLITSEEFDNLTIASNDVPGGFSPPNDDLETHINESSAILNVATSVTKASATWEDNPAPGAAYLTGGITEHDTVNIDIMATSVVRYEAEDLLDGDPADDYYATAVSFDTETGDAQASGDIYVQGTNGYYYLYLQGPVAKITMVYRDSASFGTVAFAIAEYDDQGTLGSFSSAHTGLLISSLNQSDVDEYQKTVAVAQGLTGKYNNGLYKTYVLRVAAGPGVTGNIDAFDLHVVTQSESYTDLSVVPSVYAETGKSPLLTTLNSGYGGNGPSAVVEATGKAYPSITDNPSLGTYWLTGDSGTVLILYGPILSSSPLAYWDQLVLFADMYLPDNTSITFQYSLNPLDDIPTWAPMIAGQLNRVSGESGDTLMQVRAVLATEDASATPVLYNWGIFWGEPAYVPEGARSVTIEGDLFIYAPSSGSAQADSTGFHASAVDTDYSSAVVNVPVACTPSRITLAIEAVYVGPYEDWGQYYAIQYEDPYDLAYYGYYGYWDNYDYAYDADYYVDQWWYGYEYLYYGYNWPAYFGWVTIAVEGLEGNKIEVNEETVEIYEGGKSTNQFSVFYRFPLYWQVKVHWICEGWR
jgi:hypothetical protein